MRPQGSQKRGGVVSESVPRGQPSLARANSPSENPRAKTRQWPPAKNLLGPGYQLPCVPEVHVRDDQGGATVWVVKPNFLPKFGAGLVRRRWVVAKAAASAER